MRKRPSAALSDVYEELNFLSGQVSTQTRTIALGLLALSWGLLVGETTVRLMLDQSLRLGFLRVGMGAILALVLDFFQYVAGLLYVDTVRRSAERRKANEVIYDYDAQLYRARGWFFWLKVIVVVGDSGYLLALLIPRVF